MNTDKLKEKLENLIKALGLISNINPSIRMPSVKVSKPKAISNAPVSQKNLVAQANQIADPNAKTFALVQAKNQVKANQNKFAFKSEGESEKFYAFEDGKRLNNEPMSSEEIEEKFGKNVKLVPVKHEELKVSKNGQWSLD